MQKLFYSFILGNITGKILLFLLLLFVMVPPKANAEDTDIEVHYLGHASFLITFNDTKV